MPRCSEQEMAVFRAGVLNLFCRVYPLPNENIIIYPNVLTSPGASSNLTDFRFCESQYFLKCCKVSPAKHRRSQKKGSSLKFQGFFRPEDDLQKKGLHRNFKCFSGQKQVISFWASKMWRNGNPVQHYHFFNTDD